jgi:hypothetical protein
LEQPYHGLKSVIAPLNFGIFSHAISPSFFCGTRAKMPHLAFPGRVGGDILGSFAYHWVS